ncbi:hypothetical protein [Salmonella phage SD-6_S16]|nr:hypothetical protein [Salmonella phage SD-6_S16]
MEDNGMKFDMFEGVPEFDFNKLEEGEESELVSVTLKADSKKKYSSAVRSRSQEEYETFIESIQPLINQRTGYNISSFFCLEMYETLSNR